MSPVVLMDDALFTVRFTVEEGAVSPKVNQENVFKLHSISKGN